MELTLGKNKIINIMPWKTRAKKDFLKAIKDKGEKFSEQDLINTLILPYIEPNNIYLSEDEIQYVISNIRNISIKDNIDFQIQCDNCGEIIDVNCGIMDIITYKENTYPITDGKIQWKDIEANKYVEDISRKYIDDVKSDLEMLLHIEMYNNMEITSFDDIMNIFEDMSLDESTELYESFRKVQSKINIKKEIRCPDCNFVDIYEFESIPGFFDPLLPPDIK